MSLMIIIVIRLLLTNTDKLFSVVVKDFRLMHKVPETSKNKDEDVQTITMSSLKPMQLLMVVVKYTEHIGTVYSRRRLSRLCSQGQGRGGVESMGAGIRSIITYLLRISLDQWQMDVIGPL